MRDNPALVTQMYTNNALWRRNAQSRPRPRVFVRAAKFHQRSPPSNAHLPVEIQSIVVGWHFLCFRPCLSHRQSTLQPAERYFHLSLASLSLLCFSSSFTISRPWAILSSLALRDPFTLHAMAAWAAYSTALTNCSATMTSQMSSFPPVPEGHSFRCSEPLELLPTQDPRKRIELTKCMTDKMTENQTAS